MKSLFNDFIKLFANCILVLALMMGSFLVIINLYHHKEVSYVYHKDLNESATYKLFMEKKQDLRNNIDKIDTDNLAGKNIKAVFNSCYTAIDNSKFAGLNKKQDFTLYDSYEAAFEMKESLSSACLFNITYNLKDLKENGNIDADITEILDYVDSQKEFIMSTNSFLINHMLSNSTYSFVTDITKNSIFNNTYETLNEVNENYYIFVSTVNYLSNWCINNLGGNQYE